MEKEIMVATAEEWLNELVIELSPQSLKDIKNAWSSIDNLSLEQKFIFEILETLESYGKDEMISLKAFQVFEKYQKNFPNEFKNIKKAQKAIDNLSSNERFIFEFIKEFEEYWGRLPSEFKK